ncbi:MAG: 5'-nucleotidase [Bifidobacterium crudilactis]|jgi:hypothetical protein|uniref:lamin tail domain-containing protein n=1 Tax=Bifidobacterium crudilactis TaxID=327277 RepID=UPI003A5C240D
MNTHDRHAERETQTAYIRRARRAGRTARAMAMMLTTVAILSATAYGVGTAHAASDAVARSGGIEINEVFAGNTKKAGDPDAKRCDWVELRNTSATAVDVTGWGIYDSGKKAKKHYTIGVSNVVTSDTVIPAGGYLVAYIDPDTAEPGLGADEDSVYLATSSGEFVQADVIDSTQWSADSTGVSAMSGTQSWARKADGTFALSSVVTPGAANPGENGSSSPGDDDAVDNTTVSDAVTGLFLKTIDVGGDVVTIASQATKDIDVSGWVIRDNKDSADHSYTIPDNSIISAGGEASFDLSVPGIGLGKDDAVRLFDRQGRQVLGFGWATTNGNAILTISADHTGLAEQDDAEVVEPKDNIIKDADTAVFLKSIDVGADTVILGSKAKTDIALDGWTLRDSDDSHSYAFAKDAVLKAGSQLSTGTLPFGLGKNDKVRVYNAAGKLILQFAWSGDDGSVVYAANTDADGMDVKGDSDGTPVPSADAMAVESWKGLSAVTAVDQANSFGAVSSDGEHTDGNLSGLVYENATRTLWGADNDLNPTLGITGPKGAGSINAFVTEGDTLKQRSGNGWSFTLDGLAKGGKQLHFKNGTGGVDSEGITLMNNDTASGIFIGAERDNENKKVPRPSILKYDANSTTTDTNGDGAQDLTATQEWNLTEALSGAGLHFADGDDANLGVEGVAYIPDTYLTAHGFTTIDGQTYRPADYKNSYAGLFLAAIEKNGHIYAFALSDDDTVSLVQDIDLPQTATNAGYSGPRDLIWDAEHQQLLAQGDNDSGTGAKIGTYTLSQGRFALSSLMATPQEVAGQNTEGFAITPDSQCAAMQGGESGSLYKPVYWSDDGVSNGHSVRKGYMLCNTSASAGRQTAASSADPSPHGSGTSATGTQAHASRRLATTGTKLGGVAALAVLLASSGTVMGAFRVFARFKVGRRRR